MAKSSNDTGDRKTRMKQIGFKKNRQKKSNQAVEDHLNRIVAICVVCQSANTSGEKERKEMRRKEFIYKSKPVKK